jgi:hypothetical protein
MTHRKVVQTLSKPWARFPHGTSWGDICITDVCSLGSKHGICQCVRKLETRFAVKDNPVAVVRPWRFKIPAIFVSG